MATIVCLTPRGAMTVAALLMLAACSAPRPAPDPVLPAPVAPRFSSTSRSRKMRCLRRS